MITRIVRWLVSSKCPNLLTLAGLALLLSACDTIHGIQRPVAFSATVEPSTVERSLRTVPVDDFRKIHAGEVTQFSIRKGLAFATVRYDLGKRQKERILLYSVSNKVPTPEILKANRALLDELYAALRRDIPGLPRSSEITEIEVNLPQR